MDSDPDPDGHEFFITDATKLIGVSVSTIKAWEKRKYIPVARRNRVHWRVYNEREIAEIIRAAAEQQLIRSRPDDPAYGM